MTSLQLPISLPYLNIFKRCHLGLKFAQKSFKVQSLHKNGCTMECSKQSWSFAVEDFGKDGIFMRKECKGKRGSLVVVRANQRFGLGGGGGGGGWDRRLLGNVAFAVGLTYLSVTGQLGWFLDAIVSIWLLVVLLPVVGLGVLFWYAGRDIVQSSCPNCGNDFQILKSSLNDGVQLCPFCTQPFSVQGNQFVRESAKVSSAKSTSTGQVFNGFPSSDKGSAASATIVDIEAEVNDVD